MKINVGKKIPFLARLLRRNPFSPSSDALLFSFLESMLSVLNWRFMGIWIWPCVRGVELRAEGRYSGVFLVEVYGLSTLRRGGVKLVSGSRSLLNPLIGVNIAGTEFMAVKPPVLTAVKPPTDCGGGGGGGGGGLC